MLNEHARIAGTSAINGATGGEAREEGRKARGAVERTADLDELCSPHDGAAI